jgi:hypothetical protein
MAIKHVNGTLKDNLKLLDVPTGDDLRIYCVTGRQQIPYDPPMDGLSNEDVVFFGQTAKYVGINSIYTGGRSELLVSDSFSPCVPVITLGGNTVTLAHRNGAAIKFANGIDGNDDIYILQKLGYGKNELVSNAIADALRPARRVKVVGLPIGQVTIGVIVKGSNAIVYQH